MTSIATLYTDEDISALVATLLKARGLDITTVPEQGAIAREVARRVGILVHTLTASEIRNQLLYV